MSSPTRVDLAWTGDGQAFRGGAPGGPEVVFDGDRQVGPSPVQALLISVAACMGIDLRHILERSRVPVEAIEARAEGDRADEPPRRLERLRIAFTVRGPGPEHGDTLERALALSRDTYCSVLHTLKDDVELELTVRRE